MSWDTVCLCLLLGNGQPGTGRGKDWERYRDIEQLWGHGRVKASWKEAGNLRPSVTQCWIGGKMNKILLVAVVWELRPISPVHCLCPWLGNLAIAQRLIRNLRFPCCEQHHSTDPGRSNINHFFTNSWNICSALSAWRQLEAKGGCTDSFKRTQQNKSCPSLLSCPSETHERSENWWRWGDFEPSFQV